jgi:hypothetical protein
VEQHDWQHRSSSEFTPLSRSPGDLVSLLAGSGRFDRSDGGESSIIDQKRSKLRGFAAFRLRNAVAGNTME